MPSECRSSVSWKCVFRRFSAVHKENGWIIANWCYSRPEKCILYRRSVRSLCQWYRGSDDAASRTIIEKVHGLPMCTIYNVGLWSFNVLLRWGGECPFLWPLHARLASSEQVVQTLASHTQNGTQQMWKNARETTIQQTILLTVYSIWSPLQFANGINPLLPQGSEKPAKRRTRNVYQNCWSLTRTKSFQPSNSKPFQCVPSVGRRIAFELHRSQPVTSGCYCGSH